MKLADGAHEKEEKTRRFCLKTRGKNQGTRFVPLIGWIIA
jgi:hypothetical protein